MRGICLSSEYLPVTELEWLQNTDVPLMLEALGELHGGDESALVLALHRYFVAC
jgi:hypothetical protein